MRLRRSLPVAVIILSAGLAATGCGQKEAALDLSPDAAAGQAFAQTNCTNCHTINGDNSSGPTWQHLYGSQVELKDGRTVTADDAYLLKSILDPGADVTKGYADIMEINYPSGTISEAEAKQVIEYIKAITVANQNS